MSGCDRDRLEAFVAGTLDGAHTAETRAHLAACASCAREVAWFYAERRLFEARAASPAAAPPPFAAVLAHVRTERRGRLRETLTRRAPWVGFAVAAAIAGVVVTRGNTEPATAIAEPLPSFACYDDVRSLAVEAEAYATDRAVASAEDHYAACLVATPRSVPVCALPIDTTVTCGSLRPQDDEVFEERARGGSFQ